MTDNNVTGVIRTLSRTKAVFCKHLTLTFICISYRHKTKFTALLINGFIPSRGVLMQKGLLSRDAFTLSKDDAFGNLTLGGYMLCSNEACGTTVKHLLHTNFGSTGNQDYEILAGDQKYFTFCCYFDVNGAQNGTARRNHIISEDAQNNPSYRVCSHFFRSFIKMMIREHGQTDARKTAIL